jgi:hypothetical protein
MRAISVALVAAALVVLPGCFKPDHPACAFSCLDVSRTCPPGYVCEPDGICHDQQSQDLCSIEPVTDAGTDEGTDTAPGD